MGELPKGRYLYMIELINGHNYPKTDVYVAYASFRLRDILIQVTVKK